MSDAVKPKKLTDQEKERIFFLVTQQNMHPVAVAREMSLPGQKVNGYVQSLINTGKIPRPPKVGAQSKTHFVPPVALPAEELQVPQETLPVQEALSMPMPPAPEPSFQPPAAALAMQSAPRPVVSAPRVMASQPLPPTSYNDGFSNGQMAAGYTAGWNNPGQTVRYQVERLIPNDGIVGFHNAPFSQHDLSMTYGEGQYRVLRYEPGRPMPYEFAVKVSQNFGAPKYPKQGLSSDRPSYGNRPFGGGSWRDRERTEEDGAERYPRPERPSFEGGSLYRYQQPAAPPVDNTPINLAFQTLADINKRSVEQADRARETGPESFLRNFMSEQQELQNNRWAEERRRDEDKRREEEQRYDRRQRERDDDHKRELERIRMEGDAKAKTMAEERKMIMDLEDKRLQVVREEHKIRQDQLQAELALSREQSKQIEQRLLTELDNVKNKTEKEIELAATSLKEDADREKSMIDREFDLRKSGMETEQKLQEKILSIREEQLQAQGGNEVFNTINTLIKEFSKGLEKVVELKKTQSLSSEAQVAQIAAGASTSSEGNVAPEPASEESPKPAAVAPQEAQRGGGNVNMEKLVQDMMDEPFFKEVMKEWALHVEEQADPTTFANLYLEWMRDPVRADARQACSMFANVMKVRSWKKMLAILAPKLPAEIMEQFQKPYATDFYDAFKAIVVEQIRVYWEEFLATRDAAAAVKAGVKAPAGKPEAAPVQNTSTAAEDEAPPVPTRESIRKI